MPVAGQKIRYSLRLLLAILLVASVVLFLIRWSLGPVVSKSLLNQVKAGTSKERVVEKLGLPTHKHSENEWYYTRFCNPGWVEIMFDNEGKVSGLNDESAFPSWD